MPNVAPTVVLAAIVFANVVLPAVLLYGVWRARDRTRAQWGFRVGSAAAYVAFVFLAGHWGWVGVTLRFVLPVLLLLAVVAGGVRARHLPWFQRNLRWKVAFGALNCAVLVALLAFTLRGFAYGEEPVRLALPLRDGTYYVAQGGNSLLLNQHQQAVPQRYALDIVELNHLGLHVSRLSAAELSDYVVFGAPVYSPCAGTVLEVVDGLPDQSIGQRDPDNAAGNHVVIRCGGVRVLLAHFQRGSIRAEPGARVESGQLLARVGNSGNSSEPHLHMHALRDDGSKAAAPMLLGGRFPVRNTTYRN